MCRSYEGVVTCLTAAVATSLVILLSDVTSASSPHKDTYYPGETREFCQGEYFEASCHDDDVIFVEVAQFGRVRRGRCVTGENLGCYADVKDYLDGECSGRQACKIYVVNPDLHNLGTCSKNLASYLAVRYTCQKVTTASISECQTERRLEVASQGGFISSSSAVQHGIGTSQCPWLIKANTGQKVHIYLYTFGVRVPQKTETGESLAPAETGPCREVAKVMEGGVHKMMELCPFRHGRHLVYVSQGSSVTVQLSQSNYLQDFVPFLIQYEASGCRKLEAPSGGWLKEEESTVTMGCNSSRDVWYLTCSGTEWKGRLGNCTVTGTKEDKIIGKPAPVDTFPYGILVVVAIGVALGVFFGGILLSVAALYMKRRQRRPRQEMTYESGPDGYDIYQRPRLGNTTIPAGHVVKDSQIRQAYDERTMSVGGEVPDLYMPRDKRTPEHGLYNTGRKSGHVYESPQFS